MAIEQRSQQLRPPPDDERPLRLVKAAPQRPDSLGEEFVFQSSTRAPRVRSGRRLDRRLVAGLLGACVVAATIVAVHSLSSAPAQQRAASARTAAAKTVAGPLSAPDTTKPVPMSLVDSSLSSDPSSHIYRASVSIRNPTDLTAANVTIAATLSDGSDRILKTETRSIDVLPSGRTVVLDFSGELSQTDGNPVTIAVTASAARLVSPSAVGA